MKNKDSLKVLSNVLNTVLLRDNIPAHDAEKISYAIQIVAHDLIRANDVEISLEDALANIMIELVKDTKDLGV